MNNVTEIKGCALGGEGAKQKYRGLYRTKENSLKKY